MEQLVGEFETFVRGYGKMSTVTTYDQALYFVLSRWPKLRHPGDLFGRDLVSLVDDCLGCGYKLSTLRTYIRAISVFYDWMIEVKGIDIQNPAMQALAHLSKCRKLHQAAQPPAGEIPTGGQQLA
jgi:hypothetical protein